MKVNYFILSIILSILTSCSDDTNISDNYSPSAIVEAYINPHEPVSIKITQEILSGYVGGDVPLDDLNPVISNGNNSYYLTYEGNGIYKSDLIPITDNSYRLEFTYNGKEVTAETSIPKRPTGFNVSSTDFKIPTSLNDSFNPLELTWDNENGEYHLVVINCVENNPVPVTYGNFTANRDFILQPTLESEAFIPFSKFKFYGKHEIILYRVLADYVMLYNNELFNSSLSSPSTNIINGYGIFTGVNMSDTLYVNVK